MVTTTFWCKLRTSLQCHTKRCIFSDSAPGPPKRRRPNRQKVGTAGN